MQDENQVVSLQDLLGAPLREARSLSIESAVEIIGRLPTDYLRFVQSYGPGVIDDFLYVFIPQAANDNLRLESQYERQTSALRSLREHGVHIPFAIHPEPGGILPWGVTDNGDVCFWKTQGEDPDRWEVAVADGRMSYWFEYPGTMSELLLGVLTRVVYCDIFPDDWPADQHSFVPAV